MAELPQDLEQAELKKRAMRRLIVAIILVAVAVAVLTFLSRAKPTKPVVVEKPTAEIAPPMITPPPPTPETPPIEPPIAAPPAAEQPPEAAPQPAAPPPPEVVNKELPTPSARPAHGASKPATPPLPTAEKVAQTAPAPQPTKEAQQQPKPAEKAALAAKPAEAPAPKGYVVQLGVFTNYANAQQLQARLEQNGIKSYTETRVHVGPFQNKAEADLALAKIKAMGIGAVVVPTH
jgi:DedD protein